MTPAQAAWLRKLRDEGPQIISLSNFGAAAHCYWNRWTDDCEDLPEFDRITPKGIAALEAYERGEG